MADNMAISIKDNDKLRRDEFVEQDDYIDSLEDQLDHFQRKLEAQDQYIAEMAEQIEELKESNQTLKVQARKREALHGHQLNSEEERKHQAEDSKRSNKRLKIIEEPAMTPNAAENKENLMQQLIRRSSCIFGFGK